MAKPSVGRNENSGKRPTDQERAWLWAQWQEHRSEEKLARLVSPEGRRITRGAVHRVRLEDDWDRRSQSIKLEAQARADREFAEDKAKLLGMGRAITQGVLGRMFNDKGEFQFKLEDLRVADFIAIAKFVREMQGDPTERIEIHVQGAVEQLAQVCMEAVNENVRDKGEREAVIASIMGALGRIRRQPGVLG